MDNAPLALYVSAFCADNVHKAEGFRFLDVPGRPWSADPISVAHPDDAYAFYRSILSTARAEWGMQQLFTDFLVSIRPPPTTHRQTHPGPNNPHPPTPTQLLARQCWRDASVAAALPDDFGASERWLAGMTLAAQDLGMEVQYCMACGHQALSSLQWPAVTNARANNDGGEDLGPLTFSSVMAGVTGLGWSKDNLRLRVFAEGDTRLQTLLAALSLGPVGLSDELEGFPSPPAPGAGVVTNVTLAMSTCAANGTLLQPSFPLTPIEEHMALEGGLGPNAGSVFATFTAVPDGASPASGSAWFTAVGFANGGGGPPSFSLAPSHLLPLVDLGGAPGALTPDYGDVPLGRYLGDGAAPPGAPPLVAWDPQSAGPAVADFSEAAPYVISLAQRTPQQVNVAPCFCGGTIALLGEAGKAAAVSSFRFAAVVPVCPALSVDLRGAPGESVQLLWAQAPTWAAQAATATVGADGTARVKLPQQTQRGLVKANAL